MACKNRAMVVNRMTDHNIQDQSNPQIDDTNSIFSAHLFSDYDDCHGRSKGGSTLKTHKMVVSCFTLKI